MPLDSRGEPNLHVISYNVETFGYDSGNAQRIANFLRARNPDVIALQEFRNQEWAMDKRLSSFSRGPRDAHYRFEHRRENIHGVVIFSKYPIEQVDILYMPKEESIAESS